MYFKKCQKQSSKIEINLVYLCPFIFIKPLTNSQDMHNIQHNINMNFDINGMASFCNSSDCVTLPEYGESPCLIDKHSGAEMSHLEMMYLIKTCFYTDISPRSVVSLLMNAIAHSIFMLMNTRAFIVLSLPSRHNPQ